MPLRVSFTIIFLIFFSILLLSNVQVVEFRFFLIKFQIPLMYVITLSTALGVLLAILFLTIASGYRKLRHRIARLQEKL